jgi:hypothetical protein
MDWAIAMMVRLKQSLIDKAIAVPAAFIVVGFWQRNRFLHKPP